MLAASAEPTTQFTRRDAGRLIAASALLIVAMSVILGIDFLPAQPRLEAGKPAPGLVQAPRAAEYTSDVLTKQQRDAASAAIEPQYDFTLRGRRGGRRAAAARARQQGGARRRGVRVGRHAGGPRGDPQELASRPDDGRADHAPGPHVVALDRRPHRGRPGARDGRAGRAPRQPGRLDQRVASPGAWPATSTPTSGRSPPR